MKLAGITVTYFPDKDSFIKNTESYINFVDTLYIWDNTPIEKRGEEKDDITLIKEKYPDKVFVFENDKNVGLAYAYNRGVEKAKVAGFTHIMTMDQDSYFENFVGFRANIEKETDPKVGMMTPARNQGGVYDWEPYECISYFTQSGCVFLLSMFDKVGLFREEFFIYHIEADFYFRAKKCNYKSFSYYNVNMLHEFGHNVDRKFFNFICPTNYHPLSRFYMVRNFIFLHKDYPKECEETSCVINLKFFTKYQIKEIFKIILGEKNKMSKIGAIFRGIFHGLFNIKSGF